MKEVNKQITRGSRPRLEITPPQIVGPFYPVAQLPDLAADLAHPSCSTAAARGELICVSGRVRTASGAPVAHPQIEIWQANAAGQYPHPTTPNPPPPHPNFQRFAR